MYNLVVSKFGGSITCSAEKVKRAVEIIKSNPALHYVIASAPGTNPPNHGITDMLFMCHSRFSNKGNYQEMLAKISDSYRAIINDLGINFDLEAEIETLRKDLIAGREHGYIGSRGEYIMGKILAELLGWTFVDAAELIFFNDDGTLNEAKTFNTANAKLKNIEYAVIPGFYGSMPDGKIKTFPRGDGDSSGAIVARAVNADLFEKWSEVNKVFAADTNVIPESILVKNMTYNEIIELNYIRKTIIRDSVIFMLKEAGIPMKVSGIYDNEGTLISSKFPEGTRRNAAVCISGRRNFKILNVEKYGLNEIFGFGEKLLGIFAKYGVACEHCLSGIHKIALVIKNPMFDLKYSSIVDEIKRIIEPDSVTVDKDLSLITVISEGMSTVSGKFEKIFFALWKPKINVKMLEQGADDVNIILGVSDKDYENALRALYETVICEA